MHPSFLSLSKYVALSCIIFFLVGCEGDPTENDYVPENNPRQTPISAIVTQAAQIQATAIYKQSTASTSSTQTDKTSGGSRDSALLEDKPATGEKIQLFKIGNDAEVFNGGKTPQFSLSQTYQLTELWSYHWNKGNGAPAGTLSIKATDGTTLWSLAI